MCVSDQQTVITWKSLGVNGVKNPNSSCLGHKRGLPSERCNSLAKVINPLHQGQVKGAELDVNINSDAKKKAVSSFNSFNSFIIPLLLPLYPTVPLSSASNPSKTLSFRSRARFSNSSMISCAHLASRGAVAASVKKQRQGPPNESQIRDNKSRIYILYYIIYTIIYIYVCVCLTTHTEKETSYLALAFPACSELRYTRKLSFEKLSSLELRRSPLLPFPLKATQRKPQARPPP